jgi:hypothetical protein
MKDDKLKLFINEDEIKQYCNVHGYDEGLINKTIARWKALEAESVVVFKATSKKLVRTMDPDAIESKNKTDITE